MAILLLSICFYKFNLIIILNINSVRILYVYLYTYIYSYIYICIVQNIEDDVFDVFRDRRQTNLPYNVYFINNKHIIIDVT